MKRFLKHNSLSLAFIFLFLISIIGQGFTGFKEYNKERKEDGESAVNFSSYTKSGHFIESTFENWESEFLQMALFVVFTIFLRQKGSSESKKCEGEEEVDREPSAKKKDAPWPVKKGGWILGLYKHSLSICLFLLFILSFVLHFYGSLKDENEHLSAKGLVNESANQYLLSSRFWFESFQNWQSEFLSVFAIIFLSIYLRQKGSPQSKPVDAPNMETGE
ncbi:MAG: DUF6766 family protein [Chitinophagaceae bacterium]